MSLTSEQITAKNFKKFYEGILPYLGGSAHTGFTPIGTIIAVMGKTAPTNYLACNGQIVNITDYPELAIYFNSQFNASNFFGGDGVTTFGIPDLRGEFLRGTGTNSHENQGNGAEVGVHQDATKQQPAFNDGVRAVFGNIAPGAEYNPDFAPQNEKVRFVNATASSSTYPPYYTSRPTNTSVLYCIATKNIFMDAGSNYSTEEQVVGTWIDGKPIYQKTIYNDGNFLTFPINVQTLSIEKLINAHAMGHNTDNTNQWCSAYINAAGGDLYLGSNQTELAWVNHGNTLGIIDITLQYTKTTD